MPSTDPQRWARIPPHLAWKRPGIPVYWVRVLERHPEGIAGLPDHVWLETPGKVLSVRQDWLEFAEGPYAPIGLLGDTRKSAERYDS